MSSLCKETKKENLREEVGKEKKEETKNRKNKFKDIKKEKNKKDNVDNKNRNETYDKTKNRYLYEIDTLNNANEESNSFEYEYKNKLITKFQK